MGIAVKFDLENIVTTNEAERKFIDILIAMQQEESYSRSENIKFGIRAGMRQGKTKLNYINFLGYTKDESGRLVIVPEEAKTVRLIFDLYLAGNGVKKIKKHLEEHNIKTVTGKDVWSTSTIDRMLSNEKYAGDTLLQKHYTPDFMTGKQKRNEGELAQYLIRDSHKAIIPREQFDAVQHRKSTKGRRHAPSEDY